jgi:16S rRNA (guanine1207-N2)-methyltransferase
MNNETRDRLRRDIILKETLRGNALTFHSTWGLFSPKRIDEGSKLLLDHIDIQPSDITLDLGCGYGAIGLTIAKMSPQGHVHLVDKDIVAVEYATKNATVNNIANVTIYPSNGFGAVPDIAFDNVVSNFPAKVGRELLHIFIADAKAHLKPGGKLYIVVISGLKEFIKRSCKDAFGNVEKVKQGKTYTVWVAINE